MFRRAFLLIFIGLALLALPLTFHKGVRDGALRMTQPLARYLRGQRVAVTNFANALIQTGQIRQDRENLQKEVVALQQHVSDYEKLERENAALKQELGVTGVTQEYTKVLASIVVQGNDPLDRTFVIDAGESQGVKNGQPVVAGGYLIGRIIETRSHSSRVRAIISSQSVLQVWLPQQGQKGLLRGEGNTVILQNIDQGVAVAPGTLIETSGLGGSLPQGILVGKTGESLSKPSETSQSFRVDLTAVPSTVESVLVLLTDAL